MEWKIGEIKQVDGEWYQCVEGETNCSECDLRNIICQRDTSINNPFKECSGNYRTDKKNIIFKKLEKVGEPVTEKGKTFQKLISNDSYCKGCVFNIPNKSCDKDIYIEGPCPDNEIWVEIKQNKEDDMEENKTNFVEEIEALCKRYNMSDGIRADFISEIKEIIKDMDKIHSLKPFNLKEAKEGKPVCTRNGKKARIVCFDAKGVLPIIALVESGDEEKTVRYSNSGRFRFDGMPDEEDLIMLPKKKEGWVNVYKDGNNQYRSTIHTNEKAALAYKGNDLLATNKIEWEE